MRATVHVIPCAGVLKALNEGPPNAGAGLAYAVSRTAERLEQAADVVVLAVPAGQGQAIADRLVASGSVIPRRQPARYISERGATFDELGDLIEAGPEPRR